MSSSYAFSYANPSQGRVTGFSCRINDEDPGQAYAELEAMLQEFQREHDAQCRRFEPNRCAFRVRGRHLQLGRRVKNIPATAFRI